MSSKVWDEISYPFPTFSGVPLMFANGLINFTPHFKMDALLILAGIEINPYM